MDFLTGTGLAASAGLNAYVPLLAVGLLDRYSTAIDLGPGYAWLSNGWVLIILTVLLALEIVADKVPAVDSINDIVQTIVRPTSGGIVFGSTAVSQIAGMNIGGTDTVTDPAAYAQSGAWISVVAGVVIALVIHLLKSGARPIVNTFSGGLGAPAVSTAEDVTSVLLVVAAVFLPILVLIFLLALAAFVLWLLKLRRRRAQRP